MRGLFRMHQATRLTEPGASRVIDHVRRLLVAAIVLCACTETAPTSLRYPLLEDSGTSDWRQVTVGLSRVDPPPVTSRNEVPSKRSTDESTRL